MSKLVYLLPKRGNFIVPEARPGLRVKFVGRYDGNCRLLRLFRVMWERGKVGSGGYSAKLSFGLWPKLFLVRRDRDDTLVSVLGLRVHLQRSYGGVHC